MAPRITRLLVQCPCCGERIMVTREDRQVITEHVKVLYPRPVHPSIAESPPRFVGWAQVLKGISERWGRNQPKDK